MAEIVGIASLPETREPAPTPRDVAVSFGEYYAIYFAGRHDPDQAHSRFPRRNELTGKFPSFALMIRRLDEDLENARGIMEEFDSAPLPRHDEVEDLDLSNSLLSPRIRKISGRYHEIKPFSLEPDQKGKPIPPDYTFADVRHPIARDLLDHLNVATGLGLEVLDQPSMRPDALRSNGQRILEQILGKNYDPHAVVRLQLTDALTAVFDGRVSLPSIKTSTSVSEVEGGLVSGPAGWQTH